MNMTNDQKETSNWMKLIRTTIIGGFLVVMPAYLAILLLGELINGLFGLLG